MLWLFCLGLGALLQSAGSYDVSAIKLGAPTTVAPLDLGKLKGEVLELSWASDGSQFYLQTMEKNGKVDHYLIAAQGGAVTTVDARPAWATDYWKFKSDRYAPGVEALVIDVKQSYDKVRYGTGSAGAADGSSGGASVENNTSVMNMSRDANTTTQATIRLVLLGETIGTWVDKKPTPGTTFSWGPSGSGALAYVNEKGQLALLDNHQHKQIVSTTKDVSMPAWSLDGSRLAYLSKSGKNSYMLTWSAVTRP
jgi:Tol biopolymer transport system component